MRRILHYRFSYYLRRPWKLFQELFVYPTKYFSLKLKYGCDIRDTWSLDLACAKWALPRLKLYKKVCASWPGLEGDSNADTIPHWEATLDKMIWSFQDIVDEEDDFSKWSDKFADSKWEPADWLAHFKKRQEGLELFGKYLHHLWW